MNKKFKWICLAIAMIIGMSFMAFNVDATERVEGIALKDYIAGNQKQTFVENSIKLSKESFGIYSLVNKENLINVSQETLANILQKTDETLWFILEDDTVDGMVVVNKSVPIKMGGRNRSKELKVIYDNIKKELNDNEEINYLEIRGQGVLFVSGKEEVYLTTGAAQLLDLEGVEKLSTSEFIEAINNILNK